MRSHDIALLGWAHSSTAICHTQSPNYHGHRIAASLGLVPSDAAYVLHRTHCTTPTACKATHPALQSHSPLRAISTTLMAPSSRSSASWPGDGGWHNRHRRATQRTKGIPKLARRGPAAAAATQKSASTNKEVVTSDPLDKRPKRFRATAPQSFIPVYERALSQRFFVLSRVRCGTLDCPEEDVEITGSTGNIYTVHISQVPSCTCPHSVKGNQCKHILYVSAPLAPFPLCTRLPSPP